MKESREWRVTIFIKDAKRRLIMFEGIRFAKNNEERPMERTPGEIKFVK